MTVVSRCSILPNTPPSTYCAPGLITGWPRRVSRPRVQSAAAKSCRTAPFWPGNAPEGANLVRSKTVWCGREDSNFHGILSHNDLNVARLPIPPRPLNRRGRRDRPRGRSGPLAKGSESCKRPVSFLGVPVCPGNLTAMSWAEELRTFRFA